LLGYALPRESAEDTPPLNFDILIDIVLENGFDLFAIWSETSPFMSIG